MRCVDRIAKHRIVGTVKPIARDLHDLLAERALLGVQLFQGQLGKPGLIALGQRIRGISTTVQTNIPQRSESGGWVSSFCSIGDPFNTKKCAASKCTTSPLRHELCDDLIRVGVCAILITVEPDI